MVADIPFFSRKQQADAIVQINEKHVPCLKNVF